MHIFPSLFLHILNIHYHLLMCIFTHFVHILCSFSFISLWIGILLEYWMEFILLLLHLLLSEYLRLLKLHCLLSLCLIHSQFLPPCLRILWINKHCNWLYYIDIINKHCLHNEQPELNIWRMDPWFPIQYIQVFQSQWSTQPKYSIQDSNAIAATRVYNSLPPENPIPVVLQ